MAKYRLRFEGETKAAWTFFIEGDDQPVWLSKRHVRPTGEPEAGRVYLVEVPEFIAKFHLRLNEVEVKGR